MADIFYFEGIDDVFFVPMTTTEDFQTEPVYGEIVRLPIATKLSVKGNGSTKEKWASSKMFRRVSRETKHELGLDHVGIPISLLDVLTAVNSVDGAAFAKNLAKEYPFFAFGFIGNIEGGHKKAVWYPKVQISNVTDEEYVTTEEELSDIQDVTLNMVATGLVNNHVMHASFDTTRESATIDLFEKFIKQPVFDETQWQELAAVSPASLKIEKEDK
ncbi:phage tail protein [Enterococcus sp. LJL128]